MPPRVAIQPRSIRAPSHRFPRAAAFHTSRVCAAGAADTASKNHYERLNIRHDASPGEIKKSFYSLSKAHHPDVNPSDPHAAHTFSLLSESYTILSDPSRRATYDRDVLRLHHHHHHHHHHHPHHQQHHRPGASYHSSHPSAGGRSPSGLSRRRAAFRGPPPSFYKNGAWGSQEERRKRATAAHAAHAARANGFTAQDADSSHAQRAQQSRPDPWDLGGSGGRGMGFGSGPFAYASEPPPHFDREAHERTQRREDERRQRRAQRANRAFGDEDEEFEPQVSLGGHFLIVAGILAVTFMGPFVYLQKRISARRERMD
ncbi:hypothetical protein E4U30_004876 [Claviceps sp. LM220 group G6]|nr:hypothetical protein E4U15_001404 [Claviceps sp. LM218 group G6]KAG6092843.1 hypothetical protein E4U30_004876 [Claviceps sp. LM220 group G6]KAG6106721.1 hypothetical protein E4U14_004443 [Claviceps sp. LM454 group G7]KAG6108394.1 hypothetical protein E4U31_007740 [Claviceps sp. LM219 group G6]